MPGVFSGWNEPSVSNIFIRDSFAVFSLVIGEVVSCG